MGPTWRMFWMTRRIEGVRMGPMAVLCRVVLGEGGVDERAEDERSCASARGQEGQRRGS